jgi:Fur family ferric uptake transcriptional regulator
MKQGNGYKTRQKEQILQYLTDHTGGHVTAQEISRHLSENGTPVGTATIYRFLDQLVTEGELRKYTIDSRTGACYEYLPHSESCSRHFHLKCMQCGKLYHVTCEHLSGLDRHILEHHGFRIDQSKTVLYGICQDCREAEA